MVIQKKIAKILCYTIVSLFATSCSNSQSDEVSNIQEEELEDKFEEEQQKESFSYSSEEIQESSSSIEIDTVQLQPDSLNNFIYLSSPSKKATLGTDNEDARPEDRPSMDVSLDYNFYMGKHETTREEFCKLMKCKYSKDSANYPQVNVTYFDAVLYANAMSKENHFDTVYTYNQMEFDREGRCTYLKDLVIHYDLEGFRLPTEAEWIYVASQKWNSSKSWNSENSNHSTNEVCTLPNQDSSEFCDMEGNVMEWVGDWSGKLFDTTITDYAGAPSPNGFGERILKGGCFNNEASSIHLFSRSDVYTVTSTSFAEYVGFRLALGIIPKVTFLNNAGSSVNVIITPLANANEISRITGTKKVKLVFRNDITGNLAFVYYRDGENVVEIADTIDSYHPDISPDGKYVAFCTKSEGVSGKSSLYVRKIDASGSGLVKLDVENAAIPRFQVLPNGDTVIVYVTDAGVNNDFAKWKSYSTWQVPFSSGQFGTPQKLYDGSYNGGVSPNGNIAVSGARLLRANTKGKDEVWYNGEQACNVSLSTDGTSSTLFLDFGGKTGQKFVGEKYRTHQRILVADSNGTLVNSIASPSGYTFDHSEWVQKASLSVATLTNFNGVHEKIVLVDIENGSITDLIKSDELWHPSLWIEKIPSQALSSSSFSETPSQALSSSNFSETPSQAHSSSSFSETQSSSSAISVKSSSSFVQAVSSSSEKSSSSFDEKSSSSIVLSSSSEILIESSSETTYRLFDGDSAGIYSKAGSSNADFIMRYKMELLWRYKNESNVVVIGSSRPMDAVVSNNFSSPFNVVNLAQTPNSIYGSRDYFKNYIYPHYQKMKYLIISLDIDFWWKNSTYDNFFESNYKNYAGYIYDKNHSYWVGSNTDDLWRTSQDSPGTSNLDFFIDEKGRYSIDVCATRWMSATTMHDSTDFDKKPELRQNSMNALKEIIELAAERNITVVGVIFPMSPLFKNTGAYGRYGLRRSTSYELVEDLKNLELAYPNFVFFDENKFGDHDYTSDMFVDAQHLCPEGAKVITTRLDSLLLELEK